MTSRAGRPSRAARSGQARRRRARRAEPALQRREDADQSLREEQHDEDEDDRDGDLPELEAVAHRARQRADEHAPSTGPRRRPRPPTAAQMTRSAERRKPQSCGVTRPCCGA